MIRIGTFTAICWSAIVALAWRLADLRIALCHKPTDYSDMTDGMLVTCIVRATTVRDNVQIWGATGLLVIVVVTMLGVANWPARFSWSGTKRTTPSTNASDTLLVE